MIYEIKMPCILLCIIFLTKLLTINSVAQDSTLFTISFGHPEPTAQQIVETKKLWATWYYLPIIEKSTSGGIPLRNTAGDILTGPLSHKEWCEAAMEGSVRVKVEEKFITFNYAGRTDDYVNDCSEFFGNWNGGGTKFKVANGPYGDGVKHFILVPHRTLAVDAEYIPYGTLIFIPQARGTSVAMPDGTTQIHDGYFFTADTGGKIKNNHIDVFLGPNKSLIGPWIRSNEEATFDAMIIDNEEIKAQLLKEHSIRQ